MRARSLLTSLAVLAAVTLSACGDATKKTESGDTTIDLNFADGKVDPSLETITVTVGSKVTVTVNSDVDEEVHIHGFDEHIEVTAGEEAKLTFTADVPGVYEAEMENAAVTAFELEVTN